VSPTRASLAPTQDDLRAGQAGGAQPGEDLLPQPTAGFQEQRGHPFGELVGELHGDAAAEGVAHEVDA
jgi:hypothetical protein